MNQKPDTIAIEASETRLLTADSASITIVIEGSAVFSGARAFEKAKEVSELVDALEEDGIKRESVSIRDVHLDSSSFAGIKSSACRYTLYVREISTELLPSVLTTVASRNQAELTSLQWGFSKLKAETEELRREVIREALSKAKATADALGVTVLGVYNFDESVHAPGRRSQSYGDDKGFRLRKSKGPPPEIGFSLIHTETLQVSAKAEFRVSSMDGAGVGPAQS